MGRTPLLWTQLCFVAVSVTTGSMLASRLAGAQTRTTLGALSVPRQVSVPQRVLPRTTLVLTAEWGPTPVYLRQPDDRWIARCLTPCTLTIPVGGITIATLPTGGNSVTLDVNVEGLSIEVPRPPRAVNLPATLAPRVPPHEPAVVSPPGPNWAYIAQATAERNRPGLRAASIVAIVGFSLSGVSLGVGTIAFITGVVFRSGWSVWGPVFWGSCVGVGVGVVVAVGGAYAAMPVDSAANRLAVAPILSPQMQGVGMSMQF